MSYAAILEQLGLELEDDSTLSNANGTALSCDIDIISSGHLDFKAALTQVRKARLKLSHHTRSWIEEEDDGTGPEPEDHSDDLDELAAVGETRVKAVVELFKSMPDVEELDLHWYSLRKQTQSAADLRERECINDVLEAVPFRSLRKLTLHGAYIDGLNLVAVLERGTIKHIHLEHVHLAPNSIKPLLDCLAVKATGLESFHLDDILAGEAIVNFRIKGKAKFPMLGGAAGPSEVQRSGKAVSEVLEFEAGKKRPMGSPELKRWETRGRELYGPPGVYD
ncbi:hypothetical protein LTR95_005448 [Oleoguttula sp. CCFEE 5521]